LNSELVEKTEEFCTDQP